MASKTLFEATAPFPDDLQPIAEISTISLAKLVADDTCEAQAVLDACRQLGFFLLNLSGDTVGEEMIKEVDQVFEMVREIMDLAMEEKIQHSNDPPREFRGYEFLFSVCFIFVNFSLPTLTPGFDSFQYKKDTKPKER
jgi:non-haem dioxygenase in morphine synthesis N-terminal